MLVNVCLLFDRKLESKKKRLTQMEEQLQKLEVQATDKVCSVDDVQLMHGAVLYIKFYACTHTHTHTHSKRIRR